MVRIFYMYIVSNGIQLGDIYLYLIIKEPHLLDSNIITYIIIYKSYMMHN